MNRMSINADVLKWFADMSFSCAMPKLYESQRAYGESELNCNWIAVFHANKSVINTRVKKPFRSFNT
jgi:hypothetical protein